MSYFSQCTVLKTYLVDTADSEAEGTSFNAGTVHVVTDEQDELDIASDMRSRLASHDS